MTSSENGDIPYVDVCATADVPRGGVLALNVGGRDFLVCQADDGRCFAIADRCTHAAWSLASSTLLGCEIVCGLHGARFDLRTGEATGKPASKPLRTFPLRTHDGRVEVRLPPPVR